MDKDKLAQLLQASQVPNTEQVKSVTAELQKNYYSQPESLVLLIAIALADEDSAVRQLAAVQAIRLIPKHWKRTSPDQKPLVRSHLLEGTLKEPTAANRHSLARLIAGIVGVDMSLGEGEDFLKELLPLNTSDNVVFREVGSFVLYAMLEEDPHNFSDHTHQLLQLFQSRIGDQSKEVRMNIVRGIGAILSIVEPEEDLEALKAMQGFVPSLVEILKANVEAGDEESYGAVFDVFHSFIAYDSSLLALHLRDLLMFMIELAGNTNAEDDPRSQALGFLIQVVRFRRMKIQAMKDVGPELMVKAMHIIVDLDSDDEEDMSPSRVAISLIDQLANELPPRQVIVPLLDQFPAFASHQDPRYRMAAMLALGNAAEGAPDFISTQLQPLLPTIINLLCDPETQVRHAALVGLIHLAEEMADEMASHHEQIIEAVLKNLESASQGDGSDKKSISIIRCACGALDTFGDGLDTKIMAQYGPNLIGPMVKLLEYEDSGVKSAAASAVGAIAASMGTDFQPYFEGVMKSLGNFVMIKDSEDAMNLRSSTCDSLGRIALAVGPEAFQPYVMDLMKASEEALSLDNPRLKETSFILWSNLSKVYHEQFDHFLSGVFQGIFASLELEEEELEIPGIDPSQINDGAVVIGGKRVKVKLPETDEDAEIASGDEDWDDIDDIPDLTGVTAVAMEQEIALDVLGDVISNSCNSSNLEAYVEKTIEKVVPFTDHDYEGCRKTAISTLWRIYARVFQVWEEGAGVKWEAGMPPKPTPPASIVSIGQTLREATMTIWANDGDRSVVTDINRNVAATLKSCGPAVLVCKEGMLEEVISVVSLLLTRSHNCQLDLGEEDEEEQEVDGGSSEYDWLAIDTALEVVVGLATALGPAFGELWKIFEKPILRLASSSEDLHRSTAIGTIAEITKYAGESISPYTTSIGQALVRRLSDPDALTKSNAAYAIGLLVYVSTETQTTIPMYPQLWERLEPLLALREMHVTDNVAGALSRMMLKNADVEFVAQALPAVVATLPLQEEYEENEPIYRAIYTLYDQSNPTVQQLTPQLLGVFEKVLSPPEDQLEPETRQLLFQTVQGLYKTNPDLLANHHGLLQLAGVSP